MATTNIDATYFKHVWRSLRDPYQSWAAIRASTGTDVDDYPSIGWNVGSAASNQYAQMFRSILVFDTSSLEGKTITAATITLTWTDDSSDDTSDDPDVNVYSAWPIGLPITAPDFANCGIKALSDDYSPNFNGGGDEHTFTLNATGRLSIVKTGYTCFALREATHDAGGTAPTWGAGEENAELVWATDPIPVLSVTYDLTPSITTQVPSWTETTAKLKLSWADSQGDGTQVRFQYGETDAYGTDTDYVTPGPASGTYTKEITGLVTGTTYHFRGQGLNGQGTGSGEDMTFVAGASDTSSSNAGFIWVEGANFHWIDANGVERISVAQSDVDDTPVNGVTTAPISSNWANDHLQGGTAGESYHMTEAQHTLINNGEYVLSPKETPTSVVEGTIFYDSVDKCVYVGVETE